MDRREILGCMHDAAAALAEFRNVLPQHSEAAQEQVEMARQHFEYAITLLTNAIGNPRMPCLRLVE